MGLEPMTSPLPRECSTTELHQPGPRTANPKSLAPRLQPCTAGPHQLRSFLSYRERVAYNTTRKTNSPSSKSAIVRTGPPSSVHQASPASTSSIKTAVPAFCACVTLRRLCRPANLWCTGEDSNLRSSKERQIYSLLPLTTRPPVPIPLDSAFALRRSAAFACPIPQSKPVPCDLGAQKTRLHPSESE